MHHEKGAQRKVCCLFIFFLNYEIPYNFKEEEWELQSYDPQPQTKGEKKNLLMWDPHHCQKSYTELRDIIYPFTCAWTNIWSHTYT